jgi:hypothetical protein
MSELTLGFSMFDSFPPRLYCGYPVITRRAAGLDTRALVACDSRIAQVTQTVPTPRLPHGPLKSHLQRMVFVSSFCRNSGLNRGPASRPDASPV